MQSTLQLLFLLFSLPLSHTHTPVIKSYNYSLYKDEKTELKSCLSFWSGGSSLCLECRLLTCGYNLCLERSFSPSAQYIVNKTSGKNFLKMLLRWSSLVIFRLEGKGRRRPHSYLCLMQEFTSPSHCRSELTVLFYRPPVGPVGPGRGVQFVFLGRKFMFSQ